MAVRAAFKLDFPCKASIIAFAAIFILGKLQQGTLYYFIKQQNAGL